MSAHTGHDPPTPGSDALRHIPEPVRFVVAAACLAPSRGNAQPWRFAWDGTRLWLRSAPGHAPRTTDLDGDETLMAQGAALENLVVAAASRRLEARITPFPDADPDVVARIHLVDSDATRADAELWPHVSRRATHRGRGERRPLRGSDVLALIEGTRARRTRLELCLTGRAVQDLAFALGRAEALRLDHPTLRREALDAVRSHGSSPDGIPVEALGLPEVSLHALREGVPAGREIAAHVRDRVLESSAIGVMSVEADDPARLLRAGRAVQRVWLAATDRGLSLQPLTMPDALLRAARARPALFDGATRAEIAELCDVVDRACPASASRRRVLMFRLFHADAPGPRTPRRRLEEVLELGGPSHLPGVAEA